MFSTGPGIWQEVNKYQLLLDASFKILGSAWGGGG